MNETFEHSGAWGVAAIVIVVVSWFFYRYFAPKSWREWAASGMVHWPTMFSVALFPVIALAYAWLARNEEKRMLEQFGEAFRAYRQRVPMFIPHWEHWREFASSRRVAADEPGQTPW